MVRERKLAGGTERAMEKKFAPVPLEEPQILHEFIDD
jgi:hypothetical protein